MPICGKCAAVKGVVTESHNPCPHRLAFLELDLRGSCPIGHGIEKAGYPRNRSLLPPHHHHLHLADSFLPRQASPHTAAADGRIIGSATVDVANRAAQISKRRIGARAGARVRAVRQREEADRFQIEVPSSAPERAPIRLRQRATARARLMLPFPVLCQLPGTEINLDDVLSVQDIVVSPPRESRLRTPRETELTPRATSSSHPSAPPSLDRVQNQVDSEGYSTTPWEFPALRRIKESCSPWTESRMRVRKFGTLVAGLGHGLCAEQDVCKGSFVIEFTGTVLTNDAADERERAYEASGIQDCYLMAMGSVEVIDGTFSDSLARFVNHSCVPNLRSVWLAPQDDTHRVLYEATRKIRSG